MPLSRLKVYPLANATRARLRSSLPFPGVQLVLAICVKNFFFARLETKTSIIIRGGAVIPGRAVPAGRIANTMRRKPTEFIGNNIKETPHK